MAMAAAQAAARRSKKDKREKARARESAATASSQLSASDSGSEDEDGPRASIQMNLQDLIDMHKEDPATGADAVPYNADGSVRRWPTAGENFNTVTSGQVKFLPATAADFEEGTEIGEAARRKFKLSVAASLGITPECVTITKVEDESFLEAVHELGRREEEEQLVAELDKPEDAERELDDLRRVHGKTKYKAAVKKWRKRESRNGDVLLGRVRRRKEKLERLLDDVERRQDLGRPDESDFVPARRHSIDNTTDPEENLRQADRTAAEDGEGEDAPPALSANTGGAAGGGGGAEADEASADALTSDANPYGLSAELLKAKLEFDQKRRGALALGKFTCRHQLRGGWLDESELEPMATVGWAVCSRGLFVALLVALLVGLPHADSHSLSSAQRLGAGLRPLAWPTVEAVVDANGTAAATPEEDCFARCTAASEEPGGGAGSWGFGHTVGRQAVLFCVLLLLGGWHDLRLLRDPEAAETTQDEIFRRLVENGWRLPLGLAFCAPTVGGGALGSLCALLFVLVSALLVFFGAADVAADAVHPHHMLRFLPEDSMATGAAECCCSYEWTGGGSNAGWTFSRWLPLHAVSVVTVWQTLLVWWRLFGGYLCSTWLVEGNYSVKVVSEETAGALVFDVEAFEKRKGGGDAEVKFFSGDFLQTIREGAAPEGGWSLLQRRGECGLYLLLGLSAGLPVLLRHAIYTTVPQ